MSKYKTVGDYVLVSNLGQGQFGEVYKAVLKENPEKVFAVKCVQKSKLKSNSILTRLFQTEMNVMSEINHPNIMHLFEVMETVNNYYLVIQFCNNGDLEVYLKKMGRLSEEEAVYFLMQIMNGFKVLHNNKIMHRDVKLANIFLQDDKVVIGDFGFAKQGVNITSTKLGSPITMAPEVLSTNSKSYSNKADLWSIGVCFYQMLFGKTPFDANNFDDLREKILSQSGKNLKFPKDVPISPECRNLLISLLQYNAQQRIEWKDFFNHPLFELHSKKNMIIPGDISQSMINRKNEGKVKQEFMKNKENVADDITLEDPEKMNSNELNKNHAEEGAINNDASIKIEEEQNLEENYKIIQDRYCHEKKKILSIMLTVRKIRNLAKLKNDFNEMTETFMYAACILLRKGLLINQHAIQSLKLGYNIFELEDFSKFLKTDENSQIQKILEGNVKLYETFSQYMNLKMSEEVYSLEYKQSIKIYNSMGFNDLPTLDQAMVKLLKYFKDKFNFLKLDANLEAEYCMAIVHFYYSIFSEDTFPFIKNNKTFEWNSFENEVQPENAKQILQKLVF